MQDYYEQMRYAPQSPDCPLLTLPEALPDITIELDDDVEESLLKGLVEDGE